MYSYMIYGSSFAIANQICDHIFCLACKRIVDSSSSSVAPRDVLPDALLKGAVSAVWVSLIDVCFGRISKRSKQWSIFASCSEMSIAGQENNSRWDQLIGINVHWYATSYHSCKYLSCTPYYSVESMNQTVTSVSFLIMCCWHIISLQRDQSFMFCECSCSCQRLNIWADIYVDLDPSPVTSARLIWSWKMLSTNNVCCLVD